MVPWAETVSSVVRQDIEALLRVCADVAGQMVARGEGQPFAALMDHDGTVVVRSVLMPPGEQEDPWQGAAVMAESIQAHSAQFRAAVVVGTCGSRESLEFEGFGDHQSGRGFDALVRFKFVPNGPAVVTGARLEVSEGTLFR